MNKREFLIMMSVFAVSIVVFFPTIKTYFSQDDWVFLSHVYKRSWVDVFRYYPEAFYRPIGQQLFFKIGSVLFGLNPTGYHVLALGIHALNTILLWNVLKLSYRHSEQSKAMPTAPATHMRERFGRENLAKRFFLLTFFAIHPVHLIALNWLTQVDIEIAALFSLLTIFTFGKYFFLSTVLFVAALLSHETAAMLPVIMMMVQGPTLGFQGRTLRNRGIVFFFIAVLVFSSKYLANPFPFRSDYSLGIRPIQILSTAKWYVLRALYLPEGIRSLPLLVQILSIVSAGSIVLIFRLRLIRALMVFVIGLAPVLLFSQHVFSVYSILPVLWMVLSLNRIPLRINTVIIIVCVFSPFATSYLTSRSVLPTHWTTTRGEISRKLTEEFLSARSDPFAAEGSDLSMALFKFPPASEPSFASMMGRQFEVLERDR